MRDRAAQLRVDLAVDRLRVDHPLEEPRRGAVDEALELGDAERRLGAAARRARCGCVRRVRTLERVQRARESALPSRSRTRSPRRPGVRRRRAARARAGARARSAPSRAARSAATAAGAASSAATSSRGEERDDLVPERARLARAAVVAGRLAREVDPPRRARARRVEEVAVAARPGRAARGARASVRRARGARRRRGTATRDRAAAGGPPRGRARRRSRSGACARAAGRARRRGPARRRRATHLGPLERGDDLLGRQRLLRAALQPRSSPSRRMTRSCARMSSREASPTGGASRPYAARSIEAARPRDGVERRRRRTQRLEQRAAAARRAVGSSPPRPASGSWTARPRRRPSRKSTLCAREPGVRRAQERVELGPAAAEPGEAEQAEQGLAVAPSCRGGRRTSSAYGTPSVPSAVSSGARQRSSDGQTIADLLRRRARRG